MTKELRVVNVIDTIVEDPDTAPMSVRLPTKEEKTYLKWEAKERNHHQEREGVEMIFMNKDICEDLVLVTLICDEVGETGDTSPTYL